MERGVVTLLGVRSGLFVAMNRRGKLYGSVSIQLSVTHTDTHTNAQEEKETKPKLLLSLCFTSLHLVGLVDVW